MPKNTEPKAPEPRPATPRAWTGEAGGLRPRFSAVGFIDKPEHCVASHQHPDYELFIALKGRYRCRLNGEPCCLRPWEGLLIKPGDWHEDTCHAPGRFMAVRFEVANDWGGETPLLLLSSLTGAQQRFRATHRIRGIVRQLEEEGRSAEPFAFPVQNALLRGLFWQILRCLPAGAASPEFLDILSEETFTRRLVRFFQSRIERALTVAEMAAELGMSESSLAHKCTLAMGVPPVRAFIRCKMERARDLLEHTTMSCKEIAAHLGFEEPAHFTRAYKRTFGKAPAIWRSNGQGHRPE